MEIIIQTILNYIVPFITKTRYYCTDTHLTILTDKLIFHNGELYRNFRILDRVVKIS